MVSRVVTEMLPQRLAIARGVLFSPPVGEGCIVLNLERGTILSLNDTGALMFAKLARSSAGFTRDELVQATASEFETTEVWRIEAAVDSLLESLRKTGTLQTPVVSAKWTWRGRLAGALTTFTRYLLAPLLSIRAYTMAALILLVSMEGVRKLDGFRAIHLAVEQWAPVVSKQPGNATVASACAAVNQACLWHPKRALCLQRASVLVCLLRSLGLQAELVIGVHKMPFYGHAWTEVGGKVVNDHPNAQNFFQVLSRC